MKHLFCSLLFLLLAAHSNAQSAGSKRTSFYLHVGPSCYVGQQMGITNQTDSYRSDLRKGLAWDAGFLEQIVGSQLKFGMGVLYQGSRYKNTHSTGSDKILMHYIAPQIALSFVRNSYQLQLSGGAGYQMYADKSKVYGKPRDVSMNKMAGNLSFSGEYFLSSNWGVSARVNWLSSSSDTYSVKYHDKKWNVEEPKTGSGYFGQLSLLFGINFHF